MFLEFGPRDCDISPGLTQVRDEVLSCDYTVRFKSSPLGKGPFSLSVNHYANFSGFNAEDTLNSLIFLFTSLC